MSVGSDVLWDHNQFPAVITLNSIVAHQQGAVYNRLGSPTDLIASQYL